MRLQPFLRWRMAAAEQHAWGNMVRLQRERPGYVAEVLERVRETGPAQGQRPRSSPGRTGPGTMWNWHAGKVALEWLFFTGALTARTRTAAFERVYDLTERVLPRRGRCRRRRPIRADAVRELVRTAARALGVATERDLRDYFRLPVGRRPARRSPSWPTPASCCRPRSPAGARRPGWIRRPAVPGGSGRGRC